jgi:cyclic pyranopterin phosphate synthase
MALNDAGFPVARVLEAVAAAAAGLAPVKVNMVVRRGVNEQSILPMAAHFRHSGHVLRFARDAVGWRSPICG